MVQYSNLKTRSRMLSLWKLLLQDYGLSLSMIILLIIPAGSSFSPVVHEKVPIHQYYLERRSATRLFGFRAKTKERFVSFKEKLKKERAAPSEAAIDYLLEQDSPTTNGIHAMNGFRNGESSLPISMHVTKFVGDIHLDKSASKDTQSTHNSGVRESSKQLSRISLPSKTKPYIQLSPISQDPNATMNNDDEFRASIAYFADRYTERDIALLKSTRLRIVLEGMAATVSVDSDPIMYRAFDILYQDVLPLRVAGRFIFRRLRYVMAMCVKQRQQEIEKLIRWQQQPNSFFTEGNITMASSGVDHSQEDLEAAQFAFLLLIEAVTARVADKRHEEVGIQNDREHDIVLSLELFRESGAAALLGGKLQLTNDNTKRDSKMAVFNLKDQILTLTDPEGVDEMDFPEFFMSLQRCIDKSPHAGQYSDPKVLLEDLVLELSETTSSLYSDNEFGVHEVHRASSRKQISDEKRQGYSNRFDDMLDAFAGWEDRIPTEPGRMLDVLRGCFVGARNVPVREALRIVYMDVPAMRVAGNTIFALMSTLMRRRHS